MPAARNALALSLLAGLGSASALSQSPAPDSGDPLQVTTDTPAYCNDLAGRIAVQRRAHPADDTPEEQHLATEGLQMCDNGLIRAGLTRLRRALMMLEEQNLQK